MLWPKKDELYALKTLIMSLLVISACVMSCALRWCIDLLVLYIRYMIFLSCLM